MESKSERKIHAYPVTPSARTKFNKNKSANATGVKKLIINGVHGVNVQKNVTVAFVISMEHVQLTKFVKGPTHEKKVVTAKNVL